MKNVKIWLLCVLSLTSACITMNAQTVKQVIIPEQGYEGFYIKHDDKTPATIIEILENRYLLYMDEKKQTLTISLFEKGQTIARETTPVIAIKYDEDNFYYLDPECKRENYYIDKNVFNALIVEDGKIKTNLRIIVDYENTKGRQVILQRGKKTIVSRWW